MRKKCLSRAEVANVCNTLEEVAKKHGAKYALIGGVNFMLKCGMDFHKTADVDVAADKDLPTFALPDDIERIKSWGSAAEWRANGHYLVGGVKVDWICKLSDGTIRLYELAVKHRRQMSVAGVDVWVAPLKYAVAIRVAAGRPKDRKFFRNMLKERRISLHDIYNLLKRSASKSKGYAWLKKDFAKLYDLAR